METKSKHTGKLYLHPLMWAAVLCMVFAMSLFTLGFFMPPIGVIDNSVLKAGGILLGMQAMLVFAYAVVSNKTAKVTSGKTTVSISGGSVSKSGIQTIPQNDEEAGL